MPKQRACANAKNPPKIPHTESNPYHMALYLHSLIGLAFHVADEIAHIDGVQKTGLRDLLTILEERADKLTMALDAGVFCDGWDALTEAIDHDPKLGLAF